MLEQWRGRWIVDLACGPGVSLDHGVREGRGNYLGVDVSPVALKALSERWGPGSTRALQLVQTDLEETFPFVDLRALDLVTYFYSPYLYRTVARRARPGSQILAETFCGLGESAPINPQYCLEPGELRSYFSGWQIRRYGERTEEHPETARLWAEKA